MSFLTVDDLMRLADGINQLNNGRHPDLFVRSVTFDMGEGVGGPDFSVEVTYDDGYGAFVLPFVDG